MIPVSTLYEEYIDRSKLTEQKKIAGQVLTYNSKNGLWMDWENHLEKNPIQKIEKNSKNQSEIVACEQKIISEKANFCSNTVFARYFKIKVKILAGTKSLVFSLHFLFRRDQNLYSNFMNFKNHEVQKSWKCVNRS